MVISTLLPRILLPLLKIIFLIWNMLSEKKYSILSIWFEFQQRNTEVAPSRTFFTWLRWFPWQDHKLRTSWNLLHHPLGSQRHGGSSSSESCPGRTRRNSSRSLSSRVPVQTRGLVEYASNAQHLKKKTI